MKYSVFMELISHHAVFWTLASALDEIVQNEIKTSFELMNEVWSTSLETSMENPDGPYFSNLLPDHYFSKKVADNWTFAVVSPENLAGTVLAEYMIKEAEYRYSQVGFQHASQLLQHSFWTYFTKEIPEEVKAAAFYATKEGDLMEVICIGSIWAGLFRDKVLISATRPIEENRRIHLSPSEFFNQLDDDGLFQLESLREHWNVADGDILVLASASLPENFEEVIQIAVDAAELDKKLPVSSIVLSLKAYYNFERDGDKIFAAARIR